MIKLMNLLEMLENMSISKKMKTSKREGHGSKGDGHREQHNEKTKILIK